MGRLLKNTKPLYALKVNKLESEDRICELLYKARFRSIDDDTTLEQSSGAVVFGDYRSTDFDPDSTEFGEYVVFSIRVDQRKINGKALKHLTAERIDKEVIATQRFLSRERREEIKEQCRMQLLVKAPLEPTVSDVWWNTRTNMMFMTDKSQAMIDAINDIADHIQDDFIKEVVSLNGCQSFDGQEFLTWLWTNEGTDFMFNDEATGAFITNGIHASDEKETIVVKSDGDSQFKEVNEAIKNGKKIDRAVISLTIGDRDYDCEVDANLNPILSLSGPKVKPDKDDDSAAMYIQIEQCEEAFQLMQALINKYEKLLTAV